MSVTKEKVNREKQVFKNYHEIFKIVSDNQDLTYVEIAYMLNKKGFKTKRGFAWSGDTVYMFFRNELKIEGYKYNREMKNKTEIEKIILDNQDKFASEIADILNNQGFKTIKHVNWTGSIVNHYEKKFLKLPARTISCNEIKIVDNNETNNITQDEDVEILPICEIKDLVTINDDGNFVTDSLKIASTFERKHFVVLDAIRDLDCSKEFRDKNFLVSFYKTEQNKVLPKFILTRDGFSMIAMGFTGSKAVQFKEIYINRFNTMEQALKEQYSKPIQKELSAMELMAITLKGFQEQETKVLFEIKKESESIKHETNKALESQRKEFDIKIQELNNRVATIPMIKEKVYTQTPFTFPSSGLKDTETTFKHKDSTLLEQREDLREEVTTLIKQLAHSRKVTMHNAWSIAYALLYKQLEVGFYDEFVQINDNRKDGDKLAKIDYILSKDMGKTLLICIKRLINN